MIALLSAGIPNLVIPDAHAAADIEWTAQTTSTSTNIIIIFEEVVDSPTDAKAEWTITNPTRTVTSEIHTDGSDTMILVLNEPIGVDATPNVAYAGTIINGAGGDTDTLLATSFNAIDRNSLFVFTGSYSCYDCIAPKLQETQITISSDNYIITTGDDPIHITANVGDEVTVTLKVADNKSVETIKSIALHTNFEQKPSDMSAFYANNFDNLKEVSTSFYQWNIRSDDVAYDYDGTVSWSNDPNVTLNGEYLMVPFTFTINEHMETSQITAKIYDAAGNRLHVTLPVTLEIAGNDSLNFDNMGKQKVLGFLNESVLDVMILELNGSEDTAPLSAALGISDESLPLWTLDLAMWVTEDKIDSGDLIVAVEYLIN
jgi:hypothetical protein